MTEIRSRLLPRHKTKIVCTIGPSSDSPEMLERLLNAGMNITRLNLSHGSFHEHGAVIARIRAASAKTGKEVTIMADLPGPKIRIGELAEGKVELESGAIFILTTDTVPGDAGRVTVTLDTLPQVVHPGDILYINDGLIQVQVEGIDNNDIRCRVLVGGSLRSRKGLNLPNIDLGVSAFTKHDRKCLEFACQQGVDAISQSFVNDAADILAVRRAAREMDYTPFIIAKIERALVEEKIDDILAVCDGIMVARGDLGVETPIEEMAIMQKNITAKANQFGRPVITATQMLESMTRNRRPTRAEATDVANAILDGTDCVMLSEESALGQFPLEAVRMLAEIAVATEPYTGTKCPYYKADRTFADDISEVDFITASVANIVNLTRDAAAILVPTNSGLTARRLSRHRLPVWILGVSQDRQTLRDLMFSYGVFPILEPVHPADWTDYARAYAGQYNLHGECIIQTEGPSPENPSRNHKMEIITLQRRSNRAGRA